MVEFPKTPCMLLQPEENLLTMEDGSEFASLIIVPATGNPGEQEWIVEQRSENIIALKNLKHNKYAGFSGELHEMSELVVVQEPYELKVESAEGQHRYRLYVESGGERLFVDYSMLRMYPPKCALISSALAGQPWSFMFTE